MQPELIAPGVHRVDAFSIRNAISVLLLEDGGGWTLVDTGVASSANRIRDALAALGAQPGDLTRVLVTHHHAGHVGGLAGVLAWAPNAEVVTPEHESDVPSARGHRRVPLLNQPPLPYTRVGETSTAARRSSAMMRS